MFSLTFTCEVIKVGSEFKEEIRTPASYLRKQKKKQLESNATVNNFNLSLIKALITKTRVNENMISNRMTDVK